jgi:hypothetical protein
LDSNGKSSLVPTEGKGKSGYPRKICGNGTKILSVEEGGVGMSLSQKRSRGGGGGAEQKIITLEAPFQLRAKDMLRVHGVFIIMCPIALGENEGAKKDPPLDLIAKSLGATAAVKLLKVMETVCPFAEPHSVHSCQIGGCLGGG